MVRRDNGILKYRVCLSTCTATRARHQCTVLSPSQRLCQCFTAFRFGAEGCFLSLYQVNGRGQAGNTSHLFTAPYANNHGTSIVAFGKSTKVFGWISRLSQGRLISGLMRWCFIYLYLYRLSDRFFIVTHCSSPLSFRHFIVSNLFLTQHPYRFIFIKSIISFYRPIS